MNDPLADLYPFLHGGTKDAASEQAALLESVRRKAEHSVTVKQQFFARNAEALVAAARVIAAVYAGGGKMFSMGNGGSSCDAAHFAVEFQHPITAGRPALPAMNLVMDQAMVSAVANDVGVKHIFVRQLEAHARPGDGLIGFSTSGNSENLLAAFAKAKEMGLTTVGLAGGDGGDMRRSGLVDHCLVVETDSIHRVQEVHVACYHILWDLVHTLLADRRGSVGKGFASSPEPSPPEGERGSDRKVPSSPGVEGATQKSSPSAAGKEGTTQKSPPSPAGEKGAGEKSPPSPDGRGGTKGGEGTDPTRQRARALRRNPTDAERHLWRHLRNRHLAGYKFRRQHPVGPYIVDFICPEACLVVELDGGQHQGQQHYDAARTAFLENRGLRVLRFWNDQVFSETEAVLEEIVRRLRE